jgi:hypothetical protein
MQTNEVLIIYCINTKVKTKDDRISHVLKACTVFDILTLGSCIRISLKLGAYVTQKGKSKAIPVTDRGGP